MSDSTQHDFDLDPREHGGVKGITISVHETPRQPTADDDARWNMARALMGDKAFAELLRRADAEHRAQLAQAAAQTAQTAPARAERGNIIISVAGATPAAAAKAKAAIQEGINRALERPHDRPSSRMDGDATPPRPSAKLMQGDPGDV